MKQTTYEQKVKAMLKSLEGKGIKTTEAMLKEELRQLDKKRAKVKRYVREKENLIYDRLRRKHITVRTERLIGNLYHINAGDDLDEAVISRGDIDEPSNRPLPL